MPCFELLGVDGLLIATLNGVSGGQRSLQPHVARASRIGPYVLNP